MARPFERSSTEELEKLFSDQSSDAVFLAVLAEELEHRSMKRARKLRDAVKVRLASLKKAVVAAPPPVTEEAAVPVEMPRRRENAIIAEVPIINGALAGGSDRSQTKFIPPPISNRPSEILSSWIALEVLSPPSFARPEQLAAGNRSAVASLTAAILPWERGEKSRPNCRLYYQIVLGTIKMEKAIARLIERYGDSRPDFPASKGNAILATVIVDKQGRLVESGSVSISSFGWGVMAALNGALTDLAKWPQTEADIVRKTERTLLRFGKGESDNERRQTPLTWKALTSCYEAFVADIGLPHELVEPPSFAIRCYEHFKNPNPPEPLILNSFFLSDLSLCRSLCDTQKAPENIKRYLGALPPETRSDILNDQSALEAALAPKATSLARWPGQGRHSLALLQQAAVNLAFRETRNGGILGVNGPPGTGKTTLLRDVLAGVIVDRAKAMSTFDDPETAFIHSAEKIKAGNAWLHLYRLDPNLRGFEMVVASSNNKAVENVSREIPALSSIASDAVELRYFKGLSDKIHDRETWGLVAAVLGNSSNRWKFKETFWWDDDLSMNAYLSAASGSIPQVSKTNPTTGEVEFRPPRIVTEEQPPHGKIDALNRWKECRKTFRAAAEKSQKWQDWLERLRQDFSRLEALRSSELAAEEAEKSAVERLRQSKIELVNKRESFSEAQRTVSEEEAKSTAHRLSRPGFWARLFGTVKARVWEQSDKSLQTMLREAKSSLARRSEELTASEAQVKSLAEDRERAAGAFKAAYAARVEAEARLAEARENHGVVFPDKRFYDQGHEMRQQGVLWYPEAAQLAKDELFVAAIQLHRAFIDVAAKPLKNNLGALMNVLSGSSLPSPEKEALLPDLWASLFLVVPLVSTTFAAVGRMLGRLPPKSLGWLLIDEAGQAVPQAAVGAVLRFQRAVVVGDPAQIEPVVALPEELTQAIARGFGVDPDTYTAPAASVQTLADSASRFATGFETRSGTRTVGVPLLVHRRCEEPMFSISNAIAYSGLMVQAKKPAKSPIRDSLGQSRWIHVEGTGEDKWCEAEGEEVVRLLRALVEAALSLDLYIVTPFVVVAERLRDAIRRSGVLQRVIAEENVWSWVNERVGTVHTVQGREAEAVILVLGAPNVSQAGARGWAGRRPNLLNVAVTRAKESLYVVGNRRLWREAGQFRDLDTYIA